MSMILHDDIERRKLVHPYRCNQSNLTLSIRLWPREVYDWCLDLWSLWKHLCATKSTSHLPQATSHSRIRIHKLRGYMHAYRRLQHSPGFSDSRSSDRYQRSTISDRSVRFIRYADLGGIEDSIWRSPRSFPSTDAVCVYSWYHRAQMNARYHITWRRYKCRSRDTRCHTIQFQVKFGKSYLWCTFTSASDRL